MCLKALGLKTSEDEVNKVMGARPMKGARWEEAAAAAQHYGCRATLVTPCTVQSLKDWTDKGTPVMISWNPEKRDWSHASVVFDVTEDDAGTLMVHIADPNQPNPAKTVRVQSEDEFYGSWAEKWDNYLVRRVAMAIEIEVTPEGRQVVAGVGLSKQSSTKTAEGHDCYKDYKGGTLSWQEYQDCLKRFEDIEDSYSRPRKTRYPVPGNYKEDSQKLQMALWLAGDSRGFKFVSDKLYSTELTEKQLNWFTSLLKRHQRFLGKIPTPGMSTWYTGRSSNDKLVVFVKADRAKKQLDRLAWLAPHDKYEDRYYVKPLNDKPRDVPEDEPEHFPMQPHVSAPPKPSFTPAQVKEQLQVLDGLLAQRPNRFMQQMRDEIGRGRALSEKQLSAIRQTLYRNRMKPQAQVFKHKKTATEETTMDRDAKKRGKKPQSINPKKDKNGPMRFKLDPSKASDKNPFADTSKHRRNDGPHRSKKRYNRKNKWDKESETDSRSTAYTDTEGSSLTQPLRSRRDYGAAPKESNQMMDLSDMKKALIGSPDGIEPLETMEFAARLANSQRASDTDVSKLFSKPYESVEESEGVEIKDMDEEIERQTGTKGLAKTKNQGKKADGDEEKEAKHEKGKSLSQEEITEGMSEEDKKKWEAHHGQVAKKGSDIERLLVAALEVKKHSGKGLYGYNLGTQRTVEATIRKATRQATRIAKALYKKDERTAQFLGTHAKRSNSIPARILVSCMKTLGPKIAAQLEEPAPKTAALGMYGLNAKTGRRALDACLDVREVLGGLAYGLHSRKASRHARITGFLGTHGKTERCLYARLLLSSYPDVDQIMTADDKAAGCENMPNPAMVQNCEDMKAGKKPGKGKAKKDDKKDDDKSDDKADDKKDSKKDDGKMPADLLEKFKAKKKGSKKAGDVLADLTEVEAHTMFDLYDTNKDGVLSREEWGGSKAVFDALDTNGDGELSKDEIAKGLGGSMAKGASRSRLTARMAAKQAASEYPTPDPKGDPKSSFPGAEESEANQPDMSQHGYDPGQTDRKRKQNKTAIQALAAQIAKYILAADEEATGSTLPNDEESDAAQPEAKGYSPGEVEDQAPGKPSESGFNPGKVEKKARLKMVELEEGDLIWLQG